MLFYSLQEALFFDFSNPFIQKLFDYLADLRCRVYVSQFYCSIFLALSANLFRHCFIAK